MVITVYNSFSLFLSVCKRYSDVLFWNFCCFILPFLSFLFFFFGKSCIRFITFINFFLKKLAFIVYFYVEFYSFTFCAYYLFSSTFFGIILLLILLHHYMSNSIINFHHSLFVIHEFKAEFFKFCLSFIF